jgi:hypothetical protein
VKTFLLGVPTWQKLHGLFAAFEKAGFETAGNGAARRSPNPAAMATAHFPESFIFCPPVPHIL